MLTSKAGRHWGQTMVRRGWLVAGIAATAVATMGAKGCATTTVSSGTTSTTALTPSTAAAPTAGMPSTTAAASTSVVPTTAAPATTTTGNLQLQNAVQAAKSYLDLGNGFSEAGLIAQLDSQAGDGYPAAIAMQAVQSLNEDWNAQAVLAAKGYLKFSSFSCASLVAQLDSPSGSQFTAAEAQYAAKAVGLC